MIKGVATGHIEFERFRRCPKAKNNENSRRKALLKIQIHDIPTNALSFFQLKYYKSISYGTKLKNMKNATAFF